MKNIDLKIKGMHCESCARIIEGVFEDEGILAVVDFEKCKAKISFENQEERIKIAKILDVLRKRGYKISL